MTDKKILLVEHDPAIARAVAQALAEQGYRAVQVCSGHEAVASILEERLGLVVLDLDLTDLDGYEVCRAIRRRSNVPPAGAVPARPCRPAPRVRPKP